MRKGFVKVPVRSNSIIIAGKPHLIEYTPDFWNDNEFSLWTVTNLETGRQLTINDETFDYYFNEKPAVYVACAVY